MTKLILILFAFTMANHADAQLIFRSPTRINSPTSRSVPNYQWAGRDMNNCNNRYIAWPFGRVNVFIDSRQQNSEGGFTMDSAKRAQTVQFSQQQIGV